MPVEPLERLRGAVDAVTELLVRVGSPHGGPLTSQDRRRIAAEAESSTRELREACDGLAAPSPETDGAGLDDLRRAADAVDGARARLQSAVELARADGASWRQVGETLGISGQSAHKRFDPAARRRHADYMRERGQRLRNP